MYFFALPSIEKFHDNKTQIGVKNAVNKANNKLRPSIPNVTFIFENLIHETSWHNWNWVFVGSKRQNKDTERRKIIKDQNSEKFLMNPLFEEGTKQSNNAPKTGSKVSVNNILKYFQKLNNGFEPLFLDYKTNTLTKLS